MLSDDRIPLRVLLVAMGHDYGRPERGPSYEHYNLWLPIQKVVRRAYHFDYLERLTAVGPDRMNRELQGLVEGERPDITIFSLYGDHLDRDIVAGLGRWTRTVAYFWDDSWRLRYSRLWAPVFDAAVTPEPEGAERLSAAGARRTLILPLSVNLDIYHRERVPPRHEVSFVGAYHPYRGWLIDRLRSSGHEVVTYGSGWPGGRLSLEQMVKLINSSAINLNMSNSKHWEPAYLLRSPRALVWNLLREKVGEQIKSRHIEIAACGGFQLSHMVPSLSNFLEIGSEIVTYSSADEMVCLVQRYLADPDERERIALLGWQRASREYSAEGTLRQLFATVAGTGADAMPSAWSR